MYTTDIDETARSNEAFRRVLFTTTHVQVVVMAIQPGEDIGAEVHQYTDQVFSLVAGFATVEVNGSIQNLGPGDIVIVPAGAQHNVKCVGTEPLKLYTIYSPPNHAPATVQLTKAQAMATAGAEAE